MRTWLVFAAFAVLCVAGQDLCNDVIAAGKLARNSAVECPDWDTCKDCDWFLAEQCNGQCGGGQLRLARERVCQFLDKEMRAQSCVEFQDKFQACDMQCNAPGNGIYDRATKQCKCNGNWTGDCCEIHKTTGQKASVHFSDPTAKKVIEEEDEIECGLNRVDENTFVQLKKHCGKYVVCQGPRKHVMVCPRGLFFSKKRMACLYPDEVPECSQEVVCNGEPDDSSFHLDLRDCNKYFVCQGKRRHHMPCYRGLFFSLRKMACLQPDDVPECYTHFTSR